MPTTSSLSLRTEVGEEENDVGNCEQLNTPFKLSATVDIQDLTNVSHILLVKNSLNQMIDKHGENDMLYFHVAVQLAEKVVILRRKLRNCERELEVLRENRNITTHNLDSNNIGNVENDCTDDARGVLSGEIKKNSCLAEGTALAPDVEIRELHSKLAEMEMKNSFWKQRTKEALKSYKARETNLVSENISLRQEILELCKRLGDVTSCTDGKGGTLKDTDMSKDHVVKPHKCRFVNSAKDDNETNANSKLLVEEEMDRTVDVCPFQGPEQSLEEELDDRKKEQTHLPSYVVAAYDSLLTAAAKQKTTTTTTTESADELTLETMLKRGKNSFQMCFPYPLPLFMSEQHKENVWGEAVSMEPCSYASDRKAEASSFIVSVHSRNGGEWALRTKQLIEPGMTVAQLKERCCLQLYERCKIKVDFDDMCICYYHERAQRHVELSCYRELHSFAIFQRCAREKLPIVLYLDRRDKLSTFVDDIMNIATASRLNI